MRPCATGLLHEGERDLVGGGDVGDVVATPGEETPILLAQHARPDPRIAHGGSFSRGGMIHARRGSVNVTSGGIEIIFAYANYFLASRIVCIYK